MKPTEAAQVEFIKGCLRKGEKRADILAKFSKKWQNVAVRTFDTRLKVATEAMQAELQAIAERTEEGIAKEVEARKRSILTAIERQEILTKIALGEIKIPDTEAKWNPADKMFETIEYLKLSVHHARIKAIAELNKMDGDYAPQKTDITTNGASLAPVVITPGLKKDNDD